MIKRGGAGEERERGMILVNVLLFVAIASSVVMMMIAREDTALERNVRLRDAARAQAIARGGELSALVALRRDAAVAAEADYAGEAWGAVAENDAPIDGGSFDLSISDAQSKFNVNALATGDAAAVDLLMRIAVAVRLPPDVVPQAATLIRLRGPVADLRPLAAAGIDPATRARLSSLITALPYPTRVNANSASEELLAIMLDSPVVARALVAQRARKGHLTMEDFSALDRPLPASIGFTSDLFWVRSAVTIGATRQQLTSLIARRTDARQITTVAAIQRWRGLRVPDTAPPG
jgi:general secretion pathway protein K